MAWVGPPLLASEPSTGLVFRKLPVPVKPRCVPLSRL